MKKLTIKLKQHTPLIHFQYKQSGATLRASEVKPKLDRFLIKKMKKSNIDLRSKKDTWFNNYEKQSLDYKCRIKNKGVVDKFIIASYLNKANIGLLGSEGQLVLTNTSYFAQEKEISDLFTRKEQLVLNLDNIRKLSKIGIISNRPLELEIICFHDDLGLLIENSLAEFFVSHNFGTRQTKGFGCFSTINKTIDFETSLVECFDIVYKFSGDIEYDNNNVAVSQQSIHEKIGSDYKLIKSGRPSVRHQTYKKSSLFSYFVGLPNPLRWEKRKLKQFIKTNGFRKPNGDLLELKVTNDNSAIYDKTGNQSWNDPTHFDYAYIRALLGLAEQFEFQTEDSSYKYVVTVKAENGISRFASPIIYKVLYDNIYMVANEFEPDSPILGANVNFKLRLKHNNKLLDETIYSYEIGTIRTPVNFSIGDFLEHATKDKNLNYKKLSK